MARIIFILCITSTVTMNASGAPRYSPSGAPRYSPSGAPLRTFPEPGEGAPRYSPSGAPLRTFPEPGEGAPRYSPSGAPLRASPEPEDKPLRETMNTNKIKKKLEDLAKELEGIPELEGRKALIKVIQFFPKYLASHNIFPFPLCRSTRTRDTLKG